ncbi:MAG: serine/threonine protein kinase [Betaproteobacteria bacterium]|nr:MAG: serine/threonine protein kinase [Betaproteobacteria bacterium]
MSTATITPYSGLTPDVVLNALESIGLRGDGRLVALNSYENRVYQIWLETPAQFGAIVVAKFYRPMRWTTEAILEEHSFTAELAEREIPVVCPLAFKGETLHSFEGYQFSVTPRLSGRPPELDNTDTLTWMGRFIGRIHAVGALRPFAHRPSISVESFGVEPRQYLLDNDFIPSDLRPAWESVSAMAIEHIRHAFERAGEYKTVRLHGDCHASNVIWNSGPHFVDFDDCRMGPAVQDLWMMLSGDRTAMSQQMRAIVAGYEDFCEFDDTELQLIEALRTLRLIHYSGWIAKRWLDPAFPAAFPWFNTQRYWQDRVLELREQISAMQEPAIGLNGAL